MPDEADPATLAQLAAQSNSAAPPPGAPHIQPYQAPRSAATTIAPSYQPGMQISPGGPVIQPYQPSGPGVGIAGFSPGAFRPPGSQQPIAPFTPGAPYGMQGGMPGGMPMPGASPAASPQSGVKAYVERIAKGEVLVSPEVAQRLTRQCGAAKATAKQLGEMVCERARRLYLGLDGGDPAEADAALARMLALVDALAQLDGDLAKQAVAHIKTGISEELTSLNSSAKHQAAALPMLQRLGLAKGGAPAAAAAESVDLLGGGGAPAAAHADLLGTGDAPAPAAEADLLGTGGGSSGGAALGGLFDASPAPAPQSDANALAGLNFGAAPPAAAAVPAAAPGAMPGTMGAGATMSQQKSGDAFSFVGAELSKAKA
ncbi:unnamed protein product [Prorocentrum cordatum]|uniref:Uncharacterized protein n=1 Tax=Prorocentrum cordatum TaxID=2364126 RepID=A0ABN9X311_9DINO|nr:unnamed protein product [Polarella glacialis]